MIVAERKPLEEIEEQLEGCKKVLVAGCGTCVTVCMAGGEKEVGVLASMLRMSSKMKGQELEIVEATVQRQCDREYFDPIAEKAKGYDAILSLACGVGVHFISGLIEEVPLLPALNTTFMGSAEGEGVWFERCRSCGDCVLDQTGGICPVTICPKSLLNGPCGGTNHGKCEVTSEKDCAWTLIYRRLEKQGRLDNIREMFPPRRYSLQTTPIRQVNEAYLQAEMEELHGQ